mgnify:CR=1 FL=1
MNMKDEQDAVLIVDLTKRKKELETSRKELQSKLAKVSEEKKAVKKRLKETESIPKMRDVLAEDEVAYILSLSSKNLLHYVKDEIISRYSDDEVRKEHRRILLEL